MFNKLKEKAINLAKDKAMSKVEEVAGRGIQAQINTFKNLKPTDVSDDTKYQTVAVNPIWMALKMQLGPAEGLAKKAGIDIKDKITKGLFHVRNELISVDNEKVKLDPEFNSKIMPTLMTAFKQ